jgi:hypothetical protein
MINIQPAGVSKIIPIDFAYLILISLLFKQKTKFVAQASKK